MTCEVCDGTRKVVGVGSVVLRVCFNVAAPAVTMLHFTAKRGDTRLFVRRVHDLLEIGGGLRPAGDDAHVSTLHRLLREHPPMPVDCRWCA